MRAKKKAANRLGRTIDRSAKEKPYRFELGRKYFTRISIVQALRSLLSVLSRQPMRRNNGFYQVIMLMKEKAKKSEGRVLSSLIEISIIIFHVNLILIFNIIIYF